jgi:hypothetical protein
LPFERQANPQVMMKSEHFFSKGQSVPWNADHKPSVAKTREMFTVKEQIWKRQKSHEMTISSRT